MNPNSPFLGTASTLCDIKKNLLFIFFLTHTHTNEFATKFSNKFDIAYFIYHARAPLCAFVISSSSLKACSFIIFYVSAATFIICSSEQYFNIYTNYIQIAAMWFSVLNACGAGRRACTNANKRHICVFFFGLAHQRKEPHSF